MSKKINSYLNNNYLVYTEYYLISSAYHIINAVNELLTYSASYSDNFKGYLHSKVILKQVALNDLNCSNHTNNVGDNNVDEDGFVVIKMRKPKMKNPLQSQSQSQSQSLCDNQSMVKEVIKKMICDIIQNIENMNTTN